MNPANSGFGTATGHAPPASAAIAQETGRGTSIGENLDGVGAASSAGKTEAQSSERTQPRVEEPEPAQVLSESLVQPHLGMQGLETAVVRDAGGGSGHAAAAPASQVEQFSATLPAAGRPGSASSSRSSTQATSRVAHGQNLIRQMKYAEAYAAFNKATRLDESNSDGWSGLAFAASRTNQPSITLHALTMRSKYLPEVPATYFLWATAYDTLHQKAPAASYYHRFLDSSAGKFPDQEWQARQRIKLLENKQ